MNTFRLGQRINQLRRNEKMSRRQFLDKVNRGQTDKLHEMTLYKYERGMLRIPPDLVPRFARALGMSEKELSKELNQETPLRIGLQRYPDSDFLAFAATDLETQVEDIPPLSVQIEPIAETDTLLDRLAHAQGHKPLDLALYNAGEYNRQRDRYAKSIIDAGDLVRFSGYAVLYAPPGPQLSSFRDIFNHQQFIPSRHARLETAVLLTLSQLATLPKDTNAGDPARVLFARDTDRHSLLNHLVGIAHERAISVESRKILQEVKQLVDSAKYTENSCFDEFLKLLEDGGDRAPAIFVGTLAQRLVAEEYGASLLLTQEDLKAVAGGLRKHAHILQPTNRLLVNRAVYQERFDQIATLNQRWTEAVQLLYSSQDKDKATLYAFLAKSVKEALREFDAARIARAKGRPPSASPYPVVTSGPDHAHELVARIFTEQMIELLPWERPRPIQSDDDRD